MKELGLILSFLMVSFFSIGQTFDQDSVRYITPAEEAFMIDKETKSLLKVTFERFDFGETAILDVSFEQKLNRDISIIGLVNYSNGWFVGGEMRYYHKMSKRIEEGVQGNNVSGNYFHLQHLNQIQTNFGVNSKTWSTGYGIQRRVLNRYYLDYKVSVDYTDLSGFGSLNNKSVNLTSRAKVGFGFGKRHKLTESSLCPILKCNVDKSSLFKANFSNAFNIGIDNLGYNLGGAFAISVNPDVDYEIKIGGSSWSFNQNVDFAYRKNGNKQYFNFRELSLELKSGFRYYHNLRKKIAYGKSGNNLNGGYFLARGRYQATEFKFNRIRELSGGLLELDGFDKAKRNSAFIEIGYGYQSVLLEKFYVDVAVGWVNGIYNNIEAGNSNERVFVDLKAGFAF